MQKTSEAKLITCVLPKGRAIPLLEALAKKGCQTANFANARGSDIADSYGGGSRILSSEDEKEIVTIVAENAEKAEEWFNFSFEHAEVNRKGGGIVYMSSLGFSTHYEVTSPS